MASALYQHRPPPPGAPTSAPASVALGHAGPARLADALDGIRAQFDAVTSELALVREQRDALDQQLSGQANELHIIRQSLYDLEAQHGRVRAQYEDELARLRAELAAARAAAAGNGPPPPAHEPYAPYPRTGSRHSSISARGTQRVPSRAERHSPTPSAARAPPSGPGVPPRRADADYPMADSTPQRSPLAPGPSPRAPLPPVAAPPAPLTPAAPPAAPLPPALACAPPQQVEVFDPDTAPSDARREGGDWFAVANPRAPRGALDVALVHTLVHDSVVCCVRFSPDGRVLATGCNRLAQLFDVRTGANVCTLVDEHAPKTGDLYVRSVAFSPDGAFLATGAEDKRIRIWDIAARRLTRVLAGHTQDICSLAFAPDGRTLASGAGDHSVRLWDLAAPPPAGKAKVYAPGVPLGAPARVLGMGEPPADASGDAGVFSVAFAPDGRRVAAGALDGAVRVWDVGPDALAAPADAPPLAPAHVLRGHADGVYSVAFAPGGAALVSASLDRSLKHWDLRRGACERDYVGHKDYVLSVAYSADGRWVVSGSKDRGVQFWDARTGLAQLWLQGHKNSVISIDLDPSATHLASGSGDFQARIWSVSTH